ncbi:MAG: ABC transporter ATP-binding protein [Clostridiales bacterium]|nr:ABC transporter ATP-binding protein [Clostridiales bacterium]
MITANGIVKMYGGADNRQTVLKGVDLTVNDGESVVILGASGSGKSTLLNVLSGLERVNGGNIFYGGTDITLLSDAKLTAFRREKIGFVFQQYYLLPDMTVDKNVRMGADLAGNKDYKEIIQSLGLGEKINKYPRQLSGGEQQRVAVARALAKLPEILFMDEPTGALDEACGRQLLDYVLKLRKERGFTLITVTHNENIAETAEKVVKLNSGKIKETKVNARPKGAYETGW